MPLRFDTNSITPSTGGGGGGETIITAENLTGSAISAGDKVWINEDNSSYEIIPANITFDTYKKGNLDISPSGIASNFSYSNHIETLIFNPENDTFEIFTKVHTGQTINTLQIIFGNGGGYDRCWIGIENSKFFFKTNDTDNTWGANLADVIGSHTVLADTDYWLKCVFNGSKYSLYYSLDGDTFTLDGEVTSSSVIYSTNYPMSVGLNIWYGGNYGYEWEGTIDLSQTYIKINDAIWWQPWNIFGITQDSITGIAKENIAISGTGDVAVGIVEATGTISITENGTYNITSYASADVNVAGSSADFVGIPRAVVNGVFSMPSEPYTFSLPSNATDLATNILNSAFLYDSYITGANLSSLTQVSGSNALRSAFGNCPNIITADLSNVTNISGENAIAWTFHDCNSITTVDLSNLTNISGMNALRGLVENSSSVETVYLNSLTNIGAYSLFGAFYNSGIQYLKFSSLTNVGSNSLSNFVRLCPNITNISFPSLVNISRANVFRSAFIDSGVSSIDFSSLENANSSASLFQWAFQSCPNLISFTLPSLVSANSQNVLLEAFRNSQNLKTAAFNSLNIIGQNCFRNAFHDCHAIEHIYFNAFTNNTLTGVANVFTDMLYNTGTNVTHTVHFPNNIENSVMNITGYPLFGGTSGYVTLAFDLPSTD